MQQAKKKRQIDIKEVCQQEDLQFLLRVMKTCAAGVNLNSVTYRRPKHAYQSNSCLAGLGGFSHQGFAWHFYLPPELQFRASNNLLEHLAAIITPWVDIIAGRLSNGNYALLMTNNTTSEGWLKKTNFIKDGEDPIQATICIEVACLHATHYLSHGIQEYSQWFHGTKNMVADALSKDDNRSDKELINILCTHCPSQLPQHFKIVPLPSKITLWMTSLLLWLPMKQQLVKKQTRTKLGRGINTPNGVNNADLAITYSSMDSPDSIKSRSWALLPWLSVKDGFLDKAMIPWLKKSVSDTLNFVAATFQEHGHEDPKKDSNNNVARLLLQQLRSYKKDGPKSVEQKALPHCIIRLILSNRSTVLQRAMGNLTAAAHFWAMHSCEYLKVTKAEP
jgi:hypothetical protein